MLTGPGTHRPREVAHALGVPVAAALPDDARSAALLSDGVGGTAEPHVRRACFARRGRPASLREHFVVTTREH